MSVGDRHGWPENAPPLPPRTPDMEQPDDAPPPVPTTPRPRMGPLPPVPTEPTAEGLGLRYPGVNDVFTLPDLVSKHQRLFPVKVQVVKGFFGDRGEDSAIATDEIYNIHFIKRSKVYKVKDGAGYNYIVPLNTACKFGLYFKKGTCFYDTVEDVMKENPMPNVIAAQTAFSTGSPQTSVHRLEVLIVRGISKKTRGRKPTLTVYSLTTKEEKHLSKDVLGRFTTDPSYTQMYLSDLIKLVAPEFPVSAHLYPEFDNDDGPAANYLTSEKMTITKGFIETSLVTSPLLEDEEKPSDFVEIQDQVVDIPLSLPIEVRVLPPSSDFDDDDYEQLYETTRNLISGYNPAAARTYRDGDDYSYTAQTQIFSAVRKGHETEGLKIETPQNLAASEPQGGRGFKSSIAAGKPDFYEDIDSQATRIDSYDEISTHSWGQPPADDNNRRSWYEPLARSPSPEPYQDTRSEQSLSPSQSFDNSFHQPLSASLSGSGSNYDQPRIPPRVAPRRSQGGSESPPPPPVAPRKQSKKGSIGSVFESVVPRLAKQSSVPPFPTKPSEVKKKEKPEVKEKSFIPKKDETMDLKQQLKSLVSANEKLQSTVESLTERVDSLTSDVKNLEIMVVGLSANAGQQNSVTSASKSQLSGLNCDQVLKLLEAMGPSLARHKSVFSQVGIDGDLLSQCTDEVLENELGIRQKLDRLRLLQVIRGTKSVESILQGSYVQFELKGSK